eukprot:TRINITY_DN8413_c0_g1_i1.p1 TRINITY_DN8413_c0_g1~~TRINITY_DN8413_c0_g1_i1.p1  ORF type:complete len:450 (-),score=46.63 TRINITY_DN8413_c0_g1_i1:761-2110(-)
MANCAAHASRHSDMADCFSRLMTARAVEADMRKQFHCSLVVTFEKRRIHQSPTCRYDKKYCLSDMLRARQGQCYSGNRPFRLRLDCCAAAAKRDNLSGRELEIPGICCREAVTAWIRQGQRRPEKLNATSADGQNVGDIGTNFLEEAQRFAFFRAQESAKPDALFHDPYAALLASPWVQTGEGGTQSVSSPEEDRHSNAVCPLASTLAEEEAVMTKFFDDVVMDVMKDPQRQIRQLVLLTDGCDTRAYRLPLPLQTLVFDVSPAEPSNWSTKRLKEVAARLPPGCLLRHVSADIALGEDWRDEGWGEKLERMGYRGDRPSCWILQGALVARMTAEGFQGVLGHAGSLAMKNSIVMGELPQVASTNPEALFGQNGFVVQFRSVLETVQAVGRKLGQGNLEGDKQEGTGRAPRRIFTAVQHRLSDAQAEFARAQIFRAEEDGDEAGFDDAP